jgi:hypothetical protein
LSDDWTLTVRHGSDVEKESFEDLDAAVAELRSRAQAIRGEGPVKEVSGFRDYEPGDQVHARLELSGKGLLRPPTAGIDVRGDGRLVPYAGGLRRKPLEPEADEDAFAAVRRHLDGEDEETDDAED